MATVYPTSVALEMEFAPYRTEVLADSPVGYWRLGEATGATVAVDEMGANNGTYTGGVTLEQAGSRAGGTGALFNGTTGYVRIPHAAAINPAGSMTMEAWVKPASTGGTRCIFAKNGGGGYWYLYAAGTSWHGSVNTDTNTFDFPNAAVIGAFAWTHVAITFDGGFVRCYINGSLLGAPFASTGTSANTGDLIIGSFSGAANFMDGTISDVAIYGTALSAARIAAHYAAGYRDIYADVRSAVPVRWRYGIDGSGIEDRVASPGYLTFALNNAATNSGGLLGYYSPGHTNCRAGFTVGINARLIITYGGINYYKFHGRLSHIQPTPGQYGIRTTLCTVYDWMDEADRAKLKRVAIQVSKRADQILTTLVAAMARAPQSTTFGTGLDTYVYALDGSPEEGLSVLSEFQKIAKSEVGNIYVKGNTYGGGELVFESRTDRAGKNSNLATFDNAMMAIGVSRSRDDIVTRLQVTTHPKRQDASNVVLFTLRDTSVSTDTTISLGPGESKKFVCPYTDPNDRNHRIGAVSTSIVPLVATTDYLMNASDDGLGTDLTANLSIAATYGATAGFLTLTNVGATAGSVTFLQFRGPGIYDEQDVIAERTSTSADTSFGEQTVTYDMPYQSNPDTGYGAAQYFLTLLSAQTTTIDAPMEFLANTNATLMGHALVREPGDRIGISEAATGLATAGYFIQACEGEIRPGGILMMRWGLAPASTQTFWLLGNTGSSELGTATILGF